MKKKIKNRIIAGLCLASAFSLVTGVYADNFLYAHASANAETMLASEWMTTEGLSATYNVSGAEVHSALSKDTRKGVLFTSTATGDEAENSSVTFNGNMSGLFEMDFRVYSQTTYDYETKGNGVAFGELQNGQSWYDVNSEAEIREIAITITDEDTDKSFTVYVQGGQNANVVTPSARVAYGDVGENDGAGLRYAGTYGDEGNCTTLLGGTGLSGTAGTVSGYNTLLWGTSFSNYGTSNANFENAYAGKYSTLIGFDPATKQVYGRCVGTWDSSENKRVIFDLSQEGLLPYIDDANQALKDSTFENYSVKVTLSDVAPDKQANFLIYMLNGQSLGGEDGNLVSNTAPGVYAEMKKYVEVNKSLVLPTPKAVSLFTGETDYDGNVRVEKADGTVVLSNRPLSNVFSFKPTQAGDYNIIYSGNTDGAGNTRKEYSRTGYTTTLYETVVPFTVVPSGALTSVDGLFTVDGFTMTENVRGPEAFGSKMGLLFESEKTGDKVNGSSVTFNNALTGLFELDFRVFTEVADTSADWWDNGAWDTRNTAEEIREVAITLTDNDTGEQFTVYVVGGRDYNAFTPTARVGYGDVGQNYGNGLRYTQYSDSLTLSDTPYTTSKTVYLTDLFGTSFTNRARNDAGQIGSGHSTVIGFDPATKQVYGYVYGSGANYQCYKRTILDLSDQNQLVCAGTGAQNLNGSTFENYSVKFTVSDVTADKPANFIIYGLNGQSFSGEGDKVLVNGGLQVSAKAPSKGIVNYAYKIPAPKTASVFTGTTTFNGKVKVLDGDGNVVLAETAFTNGLSFTPTAVGEYTVVYFGATDAYGNVRKSYGIGGFVGAEQTTELKVSVQQSAAMPTVGGNVTTKALKGMLVNVGAVASSELDLTGNGASLTVKVSISKNGSAYGSYTDYTVNSEEYIRFDDAGSYTLRYQVSDYVGQTGEWTTSLEILPFVVQLINDSQDHVLFKEDYFVSKDDIRVVTTDGETDEYDFAVKVKNGGNWITITPDADGKYNLKDAFLSVRGQQQTVRFEVTINGETQSVETTVITEDKVAPVINVEDLTGEVKAESANDTQTLKNYKALVGGEFVIPNATAVDDVDGAISFGVLLKTPSNINGVIKTVGEQITFDVAGDYYLVYETTDGAGNKGTFAYKIVADVAWFSVSVSDVSNREAGQSFTPVEPFVWDDFTNQAVENGFTYSVNVRFAGGENSVQNAFTPTKAGLYTLIYQVTYNGKTQTCTATLTVVDTVKPTIEVDGEYAESVNVGSVITLLDATATDNGTAIDVTVCVRLNGGEVAVQDGAFTIEHQGVYTVVYTAIDESGNVSETVIEINSKSAPEKSGNTGLYVGLAIGGVAVVLLAVGVLFIFKKKKNYKR